MSAIYRIRQFVRAAGSWVEPEDGAEARRHLPPAALSLFEAMPRYDRQHGRSVSWTLQEWGYTDPDLLAAALLHDAGKTVAPGGRMRLWHRVAVVLMDAFWPALRASIGHDQPGSWRYPFFVHQRHPALGAELARQSGCSPRTVDLIRRHEEQVVQGEDRLLAALQAADNVN
jgi:putative nucleotidyltransferase with HDIG domain